MADRFGSGGTRGGPTDENISGTTDQQLYGTERWGDSNYNFPVAEGTHTFDVTLHMAEIWFGIAGKGGIGTHRAMNIVIEGQTLLTNLDPQAEAGGPAAAYAVTLEDIQVSDGELNIEFVSTVENATIAGIVVSGLPGSIPEIEEPQGCGDSSNYICLDFEDVPVGGIPANWQVDGTSPTVTDANAHSGTKSLRVQGSDYGTSGYITYPMVPSKHFGRMYYRMDQVNIIPYLHITFIELRGLTSGYAVRAVDTNLSGNNINQMKYILNIDANGNEGGPESADRFSYNDPLNNWVCVEWEMDPDTQNARVWVDGSLAVEGGLHHPSPNQIPGNYFQEVGIGLRTYKGAYSSGWVDDVVIGPNRINCN